MHFLTRLKIAKVTEDLLQQGLVPIGQNALNCSLCEPHSSYFFSPTLFFEAQHHANTVAAVALRPGTASSPGLQGLVSIKDIMETLKGTH